MEARHVSTDNLQIGDALPWDVFDDNGQLLLCRGYVLQRASQIEVLVARGLQSTSGSAPVISGMARQARRYDPFRVWDSIQNELEALLKNIRLETDFSTQIDNVAGLIQTLAEKSPDTALAAIIMADQKRYAVAHSLHVAMLCELVARRMDWSAARRHSVCCAAMTMNLAMLNLQAALCVQRMPPTQEQRRDILRHPQLADEMLALAGVKDALWRQAVMEHHEKPGGGGYPFGMKTPCEEAVLIRTADIFSAKVAPRAARAPYSPHEAAKSVFLEMGSQNPNIFAAALIKEIGMFPPGTFVNLANGETAIILKRGASANTPIAISLVSPSGMSYAAPVQRDTANKSHEVVAVLPRDKVRIRINPEKLWHH